jgi:formate hydrogenlyase subunit 6/NADH:ubiquinone oxidoreductase subunit I
MKRQGANSTYWGNIIEAVNSLLTGLKLSIRHLFEARDRRKPIGVYEKDYFEQKSGIFTLQYPHESIPVPENGRYRLHNDIEDCIVCDKCAKICPVDCIEIEPVKAVEEIGKTSDGTPKRIYAARFDIDMGKCCFCGLCTTVCPTECLTMTKAYDFTEYDVADHIYAFAEMSPLEILEKQQALEKYNREKELAKAAKTSVSATKEPVTPEAEKMAPTGKPAFKPRMPMKPKSVNPAKKDDDPEKDAKAKALELMKAKTKASEPAAGAEKSEVKSAPGPEAEQPKAKKTAPVVRPKIITKKPEGKEFEEDKIENKAGEANDDKNLKPSPAKPVFRPRPMIKKPKGNEGEQ